MKYEIKCIQKYKKLILLNTFNFIFDYISIVFSIINITESLNITCFTFSNMQLIFIFSSKVKA